MKHKIDTSMTVNMILEAIYNSEIPCRLEWMFDAGFTWSIQGKEYPRLWIDDSTDEKIKIMCESEENVLWRNNPFLKKDWIARGCNYGFNDAVLELAEAVYKNFPKSPFGKWWGQMDY